MHKLLKLAAGAFGVWWAAGEVLSRSVFQGKVVLITGGSRGLGLILARNFAARGARLAICARDPAELEAARDELVRAGAQVLAIACDVSDAQQARIAVEQAVRAYGALDVLVNNAGIIQVAPFEEMGLLDYRQAMEINYFGMLHTTLAALPFLRRHRGRIVNVASIGGAVPVPHLLPYSASKFAAVGFSQGLCVELRRSGVKVTTVLPGVMRTGSFVRALFKGRREREVSWFSLVSSLPVASISAERAARRILVACARGETHLTVGLPAKVLRLVHALVPGLNLRLLSLANRLLPAPGGAGPAEPAEPGWLHRPLESRGPLTKLGDDASRQNRELPWLTPAAKQT